MGDVEVTNCCTAVCSFIWFLSSARTKFCRSNDASVTSAKHDSVFLVSLAMLVPIKLLARSHPWLLPESTNGVFIPLIY